MSFMQPQIEHGDYWSVETDNGITFLPCDIVPNATTAEDFADYCEGTPESFERLENKYGARLSAPGYMDCTEWSVFDSEQEAIDHLAEHYDIAQCSVCRQLIDSDDETVTECQQCKESA